VPVEPTTFVSPGAPEAEADAVLDLVNEAGHTVSMTM